MKIVITRPVHRITTVRAHHAPQREERARCPRRDEGADLGSCASCSAFHGFSGGDHRAIRCAVDAASIDAPSGTVGALMTRELTCVEPDVDISMVAWLVGHEQHVLLPVVEAHKPVGVVSTSDLVRALSEGRLRDDEAIDSIDATVSAPAPCRVARDVMSAPALVLRADMDVASAAEKLSGYAVHAAPVVDGAGHLVGVITTLDLLRVLALPSHPSLICPA